MKKIVENRWNLTKMSQKSWKIDQKWLSNVENQVKVDHKYEKKLLKIVEIWVKLWHGYKMQKIDQKSPKTVGN